MRPIFRRRCGSSRTSCERSSQMPASTCGRSPARSCPLASPNPETVLLKCPRNLARYFASCGLPPVDRGRDIRGLVSAQPEGPTVHPQHDGGKWDRSIRAAIDVRSRKARRQIEGVGKGLVGETSRSETACGIYRSLSPSIFPVFRLMRCTRAQAGQVTAS
jgi:hypothetical protein